MMNILRYKILKENNLILAQIINTDMEIHECIQKLSDMIYADADYSDDMDFIADMKKPNYPSNEFYFNELDRLIHVNVRFNRFIRVICPLDHELKKNYKIFQIFSRNNAEVAKANLFVQNLTEALDILDIPSGAKADEIINFYTDYTIT